MSRRDQILDMWAAGIASPQISAELGVTADYVRRVAYRARAERDPRAVLRVTGSVSLVNVSDVQAKLDRGVKIGDIAAECGFSKKTIYHALRRASGVTGRNLRYSITHIKTEAERRGLTSKQLRSLLLKTIERDRLVNAVLDDEVAS